MPGLCHPQSKEVLPRVQMELPVSQFVPAAPCPVAGHHSQEPGPVPLTPPSGVCVRGEDPSQPSPRQAGQPRLSQPFVIRETLQSPHHLCSPSLDPLPWFLVWNRGAQHWARLQLGPHQGRAEGRVTSPHLPATLLLVHPRAPLAPWPPGHTAGSWAACCPPAAQSLPRRAAPQQGSPSLCCCVGLSLPGQDPTLALVALPRVPLRQLSSLPRSR